MTLKELALEILELPTADLDKPAGVWPPDACPNSSFVRVDGVKRTPAGEPVITTGKPPVQLINHADLKTFDGRDNRREIMILLQRLGSDRARGAFLESLIPHSLKGFAGAPLKVEGRVDCAAAYFMLVGVCNELGVSINTAAQRLEKRVKEVGG